jgi:hypothetical protein
MSFDERDVEMLLMLLMLVFWDIREVERLRERISWLFKECEDARWGMVGTGGEVDMFEVDVGEFCKPK